MSKILLVLANTFSEGMIHIGTSMLISVLKHNNDIKLFDTTFYPKEFKSVELRKWREKTLEYKPLEEDPYQFNTTDMFEDFKKLYEEFNPDLIMVSVTSLDYELGLNILKDVKNTPVLMGGIHAIVAPEDLIQHPKVDYVFRGEAEEIIEELVKKIINKESLKDFKGLWYKKDGKIYRNDGLVIVDDLEKLPMPDWSYFDKRHFRRPFKGKIYQFGTFELARGCPYHCTYCINHIVQKEVGKKNQYREKSVNKCINEIKILAKKYDLQMMKFWDENFLGFKKNTNEFLERYKEEIKLPFMIQTRPEGVSEETAKLLKEAKCVNLSVGVESGSERIRKDVLKRYQSNEQIIKGFQNCNKYGLRTTAFIIMGLPTETRENIFESIELMRKCNPTVLNTFFLYPFKGTEIRQWCIDNKWLDPKQHQEHVDMHFGYILKNPNFTREDLLQLRKVFSMYVFSDKKYWPIIERMEQGDDLLYDFANDMFKKVIHGV